MNKQVEQIKAIVKDLQEYADKRYEEKREEYWEGYGVCADNILLEIDDLKEEPVSKDLEEAAESHAAERFRTTRDKQLAEKCKWSFIAGAKWKEEVINSVKMERNKLKTE